MPNVSPPDRSLVTIEFDRRLDPDAYAAVIFACWATLVAGGHSQHAGFGRTTPPPTNSSKTF